MSSESVEAVGQLSPSLDWRRKGPKSAGAFQLASVEPKPPPLEPDGAQLSPLAQLVGTLEALGGSDPARYTQVTRQIAIILLSAAQLAGSRGDAAAAKELDQLAADFSDASGSGQLHTLLKDLTLAAGAGSAASASGILGDGRTGAKALAFLRTTESRSAQNAALDEAAVFVRTVSTVVVGAQDT